MVGGHAGGDEGLDERDHELLVGAHVLARDAVHLHEDLVLRVHELLHRGEQIGLAGELREHTREHRLRVFGLRVELVGLEAVLLGHLDDPARRLEGTEALRGHGGEARTFGGSRGLGDALERERGDERHAGCTEEGSAGRAGFGGERIFDAGGLGRFVGKAHHAPRRKTARARTPAPFVFSYALLEMGQEPRNPPRPRAPFPSNVPRRSTPPSRDAPRTVRGHFQLKMTQSFQRTRLGIALAKGMACPNENGARRNSHGSAAQQQNEGRLHRGRSRTEVVLGPRRRGVREPGWLAQPEAVPTNGTLQVREWEPKEDRDFGGREARPAEPRFAGSCGRPSPEQTLRRGLPPLLQRLPRLPKLASS